MKFNWKVEDMYLMNHKSVICIGNHRPYTIELTMNRDEKIEFIDSQTDGAMSYMIGLDKQFKADATSMKKDAYGNVKTQSLIAWIRRNDPRKMIDETYRYGRFRIIGCERFIQDFDHRGAYDYHQDIVDEVFHRLLNNLCKEEERYFRSIDPYEIAKAKLRDNVEQYHTTFDIAFGFSSTGEIKVYRSPEDRTGSQITIEQCNYLNSKFEQLEKFLNQMKEDIAAASANLTFNSDNGGETDGSETTD